MVEHAIVLLLVVLKVLSLDGGGAEQDLLYILTSPAFFSLRTLRATTTRSFMFSSSSNLIWFSFALYKVFYDHNLVSLYIIITRSLFLNIFAFPILRGG